MPNDPVVDNTPIALSPETYARHSEAVAYVEDMIRTRAPRSGNRRFPGLAPGAWGLLAAGDTISAASGLSLGSGTVKLCDRTGAVLPANESVDVSNAYAAMDGGTGGKIVRLAWVLGEWACSCPGGT
jgi:hypothetical protein